MRVDGGESRRQRRAGEVSADHIHELTLAFTGTAVHFNHRDASQCV